MAAVELESSGGGGDGGSGDFFGWWPTVGRRRRRRRPRWRTLLVHLLSAALHLPWTVGALPNTASLAKTRRILLAHHRWEPHRMEPMQLPDTGARCLTATGATASLRTEPPFTVLCRCSVCFSERISSSSAWILKLAVS